MRADITELAHQKLVRLNEESGETINYLIRRIVDRWAEHADAGNDYADMARLVEAHKHLQAFRRLRGEDDESGDVGAGPPDDDA